MQAEPQNDAVAKGARRAKNGCFLLLIGIVVLLAGAYFGNRGTNYDRSQVMCGDRVMQPTDLCVDYGGSGGGTFEEMRVKQERSREIDRNIGVGSRWVGGALAILGPLLLVLGGVQVFRNAGDGQADTSIEA